MQNQPPNGPVRPPNSSTFERRASVSDDGKRRDRRQASYAIFLVLPLAFLLFAQWPLRAWVEAYSRDANNLAQIVFALYAAAAITAASRAKAHLAFVGYRKLASRKITILWRSWARLACVAPWAVFILWTGVPQMVESTRVMEKFNEGFTPGYFILRIALVLLALLVLVHALGDVYGETRRRRQSKA